LNYKLFHFEKNSRGIERQENMKRLWKDHPSIRNKATTFSFLTTASDINLDADYSITTGSVSGFILSVTVPACL